MYWGENRSRFNCKNLNKNLELFLETVRVNSYLCFFRCELSRELFTQQECIPVVFILPACWPSVFWRTLPVGVALFEIGAFTTAILQTIMITMQLIVLRIVHAIVHILKIADVIWPLICIIP